MPYRTKKPKLWLSERQTKGTNRIFYPLPKRVMGQLRRYVSQNGFDPDGRIFPISECRVEQLVKSYSRIAGIADYRMASPHRLRAFFATDSKNKGLDAFVIRDLMRHVSIKTTNEYVGRSTPEEVSNYMEFLARRGKA